MRRAWTRTRGQRLRPPSPLPAKTPSSPATPKARGPTTAAVTAETTARDGRCLTPPPPNSSRRACTPTGQMASSTHLRVKASTPTSNSCGQALPSNSLNSSINSRNSSPNSNGSAQHAHPAASAMRTGMGRALVGQSTPTSTPARPPRGPRYPCTYCVHPTILRG